MIENITFDKIKVLDDRVLIKIPKKDDGIIKSKGGIIIPQSTDPKKKTDMAEIVKLGRNANRSFSSLESKVEDELKIGNTVIFDKYSGVSILINDEIFIIVKACDILAVFEE
jgi:chaperonin GroES